MNLCDPFSGTSHTEFGGASGTLSRDQRQAPKGEDMDPHAKIFPDSQFVCNIKQFSFVFNQDNQLSNFYHNIGKMKNMRISLVTS